MSNKVQANQTKDSTSGLTRTTLDLARKDGGSVTYFRKVERYNVRTHKTYTQHESILTAKLNPQLLHTENGKNTPFTSVLAILRSTCESLGADYFVVSN